MPFTICAKNGLLVGGFRENNFKISVLYKQKAKDVGMIYKHLVIFHDGFALR